MPTSIGTCRRWAPKYLRLLFIDRIHVCVCTYTGGVDSVVAACPPFLENMPAAVTFEFLAIDCVTMR